MTENKRIFWNVIATYGRSLYGIVLGLFCGRWTLMALGEVDYGLMGLVGGLTVFISFFNGVLASANARFYAYSVGAASAASDKVAALEECRRWFNLALAVHLVVPLVLIVVGYPLGVMAVERWLTIPLDRIPACIWVFRFVCISCFVGMLNVPFTAMYEAKQYIAELTIYAFVTSTLNVVVLYYMVSNPGDWLTRYAAWTCLMLVVPQIIICLRAFCIFPECHVNLNYMKDVSRLKRLGVFSGWQMIGCFCGMLRTNGMSIVVNKFFGAAMNAAQSVGNTVQGHCNTLAAAMQGAFTPVITQACGAGDHAKMCRFAMRTCKFNLILYLIFAIPLALELPEVLRLWLKNPPAFSTGLCFCAMAFHLVGCCTVGHMIVVNATGIVAGYYKVLGTISIFTVPLSVLVGFITRNVFAVMYTVVLMETVNSLGRVWFARKLVCMSVKSWIQGVIVPVTSVTLICCAIGYLPHILMKESLLRVGITSVVCLTVFMPLTWFVLLSAEERHFVSAKIISKLGKMIGGK